MRGWGRQSVVPGVPLDRPCAGRPLAVRSRGGPWRPTRVPQVALSHSPRSGARPPHLRRRFLGVGLVWPHPVGAPLRFSVPLSPLPVCRSPRPRPSVSGFLGPPRPRSFARFAGACPPPQPSHAGRGGAPVTPAAPPLRCARPSAGGVPGLPPAGRSPCPHRPASPTPLGRVDRWTPRARVCHAGCGLGGLATVEEGGPPPSSPTLVDLDCVRLGILAEGGRGRSVSRPSERLLEAPLPAASPWGSSCSPAQNPTHPGPIPLLPAQPAPRARSAQRTSWWLRW